MCDRLSESRDALVGLRVLLVEDHPDTLVVMARLLRRLGCAVETAASVGAAVALCEREDFDVLVSDLGLPDGSGLDVMRRVRATRPVRGVALTGSGEAEDVRQCREAGFEVHLTKPVDFGAFETALVRLSTSA